MSAVPAQSSTVAASSEPKNGEARAPLCFVVDADASIRHFLSLILHGAGIDTEEFPDGQAVRTALARRQPKLVFLNIALEFRRRHRVRHRAWPQRLCAAPCS